MTTTLQRTALISLLLILTVFFHAGAARAATLTQTFELLAPPNIRDPYVLDIPFQVNKVGMINVHVTFESASSDKVQQFMTVLMQDVYKGQRARTKVKPQQSAQITFAADSMNLKQTHRFFVRLINPDLHGSIRGRVIVDYPGQPNNLPDLVITNTRTDAQCHLIFTLSNKGNGSVDLSAWDKNADIDVAIERNNHLWGATSIKVIDPIQRLVHPGGFAHYRTNLVAPDHGTENIALVVDRKNRIRESNEQNNRQNYALSCALPDLVISKLYLDDSCHVVAEVKNAGNGKLLPEAFAMDGPSVFINRNGQDWGGQALKLVDPQQQVSNPGGSVRFVSNLKLGAQAEKIQVLVNKENKVREKNDNNNFRNAELKCEPKAPIIKMKPMMPMRMNMQ